jgi:uncharacterized protein YbaA (DUF1428 family)
MAYVDVIVNPVPKKKLAAYKKLVRQMAAVWKRCGAIAYHELLADDVKPGKLTSFPQSVKLKAGEMVGCSYVVFRNKAERNKAWKAMMKEPLMANFDWKNAPFDGKRMFYGGFKTLTQF